jgi:hypothetical protein
VVERRIEIHHRNHRGHEERKLTTEAQRHGEVMGRKMQATSAEVTEKRGLWFVDYSSLI